MSHQRILSSRFNMSLGFIPVIISIILCEFITQDMSIYIGAGVGLLFSIYSVRHRGTHVPQIILYCTTGMLLLLSVTTLFLVNYCPRFMLPFTLEISAIIPPFVIYLNRRKFLDYHMSQTQKCCKQLFAQGAEAAIVSSRVILIISLLHFLIIFLAVLVSLPFGGHYPPHSVLCGASPRLYIRHSVQSVRHFLFQYSDEPHGFRTDSQYQRRCHGESHRLRSHQPEKRLYQSGHPDCRCLTRHAVSPPPPQMQRFRER